MNKPIVISQDLKLSANLDTIIKYHPASKVYLNDETAKNYSTTINIKILAEETDGVQSIIPDYQYANIVDKTLPDPSHENNLLVLVWHLVELEWGYFKTYYILDNGNNTFRNHHTEVTRHLKELKTLISILEKGQVKDVVTKLNLTEVKTVSGKDKRYNVPEIQIETVNPEESLQVIQLLANNRIKELMKPEWIYQLK